jgi:catechol 2,3-dioxygenase-like lactoylglutathione lyase family enzyme
MPALSGILETALHVDDLERSAKFYEGVFGLRVIAGDTRFRAYSVSGHQVLLLFRREENPQPFVFSGGTIPPHGSCGEIHFAFAIERSELVAWEKQFARCGVEIEGRVSWRLGGESIYFRDPDRHLGELATRGTWSVY